VALGAADDNETVMADNLLNGRGLYYGDDKLGVRFFMHPVENEAKSAAEGRPIFVEEEYVKITTPGDRTNVQIRPVEDTDRKRFASRYKAFLDGATETIVGTPLSAWPVVTRAQVEEMKFFNIQTVEQLAGLPDSQAAKYVGIQSLKQRAKDFLEASKGAAPLTALRAEMEQKDAETAALRQALDEMKKQILDLQKKK
jgi:hypothetical protein